MQHVNVTAAASAIAVNTTTSTNITAMTTIATMLNGMTVKFPDILKRKDEINRNRSSVCQLSKGHISNICLVCEVKPYRASCR